MQYPMRIEAHEYVSDSAGAGRWRGAPGVGTRLKFLADNITNAMLAGVRHPTRGLCGAENGPPNALSLTDGAGRTDVSEVVYNHRLQAGASIEFLRGGGGGWGDPLDRPVEEVLADIHNRYVSVDQAEAKYGVIADPEGLAADPAATDRKRAEMRHRRVAETSTSPPGASA